MNNPIWIMTSAFPGCSLDQVIEHTKAIGAQGMDSLSKDEKQRLNDLSKRLRNR